jgi:uncharacterized protein (TIGR02453 family)
MNVVPAAAADKRAGSRFTGFPLAALGLLAELAANNRRDWFAQHRAEVEAFLLDPSRALIRELAPRLRRLSPGLRAEPHVGGSILRLQRDARFARESPFKDHLELWFWEGSGPSRLHPGFFLRLAAHQLIVGGGIRSLPPESLAGYRRAVDEPGTGLELTRLLGRLARRGWSLRGHRLRGVPPPYPPEHERADLLRRTGLWVECQSPPPDELFDPELVTLVSGRFRALLPLHRWLLRVTG